MYEITTLDNGLRILTVTLPYVQSASLGFFLGVGSRYESASMSGASHFVEHMLFKGTTRHPSAQDIAEAIESKGGLFNASTGLETTLYWAKVAAAYLPEALDVLSDMLRNATFDPVQLERERIVIGEEINYGLDAPDSLAQILVAQLQWPDHPLGRDVAGSHQTVGAMTRQSLLDYLSEHYRPERTILGVAGLVRHKEVVDWANANLGDWAPGRAVAWEPAPALRRGPNLQVEFRDTEQAHLCFSFSAMSRSDPDRHALRLLNVMLGEGMRSRLFQEIREKRGLAYSVDSFASTLYDTGTVGIYAGVGPERADEAIRAILAQLDRLRQEPVPSEELKKSQDFVRGRLYLSLEDSFSMASWFARQMILGTEVLTPEQASACFDTVQAADIQRLAQRIFQEERMSLAIVGPFGQNGHDLDQAIRF